MTTMMIHIAYDDGEDDDGYDDGDDDARTLHLMVNHW